MVQGLRQVGQGTAGQGQVHHSAGDGPMHDGGAVCLLGPVETLQHGLEEYSKARLGRWVKGGLHGFVFQISKEAGPWTGGL